MAVAVEMVENPGEERVGRLRRQFLFVRQVGDVVAGRFR
jgi:hypothetical protein